MQERGQGARDAVGAVALAKGRQEVCLHQTVSQEGKAAGKEVEGGMLIQGENDPHRVFPVSGVIVGVCEVMHIIGANLIDMVPF